MNKKDVIKLLRSADEDSAVWLSEEYHGISENDNGRLWRKVQEKLKAKECSLVDKIDALNNSGIAAINSSIVSIGGRGYSRSNGKTICCANALTSRSANALTKCLMLFSGER